MKKDIYDIESIAKMPLWDFLKLMQSLPAVLKAKLYQELKRRPPGEAAPLTRDAKEKCCINHRSWRLFAALHQGLLDPQDNVEFYPPCPA